MGDNGRESDPNENYEEDVEERIFEGISNDVLVMVTVVIAYFFALAAYSFFNRKTRRVGNVHPDIEEEIREYREVYERVNAPLPDEDGVRRLVNGRQRSDGQCPICLDTARFPVLSDCGHVFCCNCIIGYWRHSVSPLSTVKCAVCRADITMILPMSWPAPSGDPDNETTDEAIQEANIQLDDYNRRFSGERSFMSFFTDIPILIPYIMNNLTAYGAMIGMFRVRAYLAMVGIVIYVLCPLDVLPENVYGVMGLLDDLVIAVMALAYVCIALRQHMGRRGEAPPID